MLFSVLHMLFCEMIPFKICSYSYLQTAFTLQHERQLGFPDVLPEKPAPLELW